MMILSGQPISASQRVITDPSNSGVPSAWSSVLFRASRIRTEFTHTTSSAGLVFSAAPFTTRQVVEEDAADSITVGSGISQVFDEVVADAVSILGFAQAGLIEDVLEAVQAKSTAGSTRASSGVLADYLRSSDLIARAMDAALGDVMAIAGSVLARNRATYTVQDHVTILAAAASVLYAVADVSVTVLAQDYNAAVAEEILDAQAACISAADTWLLAASTIIENIQVAASADPSAVVTLVMRDDAVIEDAHSVNGIYNAMLRGDIEAYVTFNISGEEFTCWCTNAEGLATSEYRGYNFNSLCRMGDKYLGAGEAGIYLLDGDTDDGGQIDASLLMGLNDFGTPNLKHIPGGYLTRTADGEMRVAVITVSEGVKHVNMYKVPNVVADSPRTSQVRFGKGLRARYWQFELSNIDGGDFTIDEFELMSAISMRRV